VDSVPFALLVISNSIIAIFCFQNTAYTASWHLCCFLSCYDQHYLQSCKVCHQSHISLYPSLSIPSWPNWPITFNWVQTYNIINQQTLFTQLWRWLLLRLSKCQSPTIVLFRTALTRTITLHCIPTTDTVGFIPLTMINITLLMPLLWHLSCRRMSVLL